MDGKQIKPLAVVTGASSGIGYELAKQLVEHGYDLVVCAEDAGLLEASQVFLRLGAEVHTVRVDLAERLGVEQLWAKVESLGRPVDVVAINAGVGVGGDFLETDLDRELKLIDLNCASAVHLAKRAAKAMVEHGEGRILFTSSIAAVLPAPFEAVYGASKAFLFNFAEGLRNELKDKGITVTALMPGPTETNFFHRADMDDTKAGADRKDDAEVVARQAVDALLAGKDRVVAGSLKNKLMAGASKLIPQKVAAALHRRLSEPGSANK